jgi:hypothetical protein
MRWKGRHKFNQSPVEQTKRTVALRNAISAIQQNTDKQTNG